VGLPGAAVKEGAHRARSGAYRLVGGLTQHQRHGILINLSPADLRKTGRSLDLGLAMIYAAVLCGTSLDRCKDLVFMGEVGLDGEVRGVPGILPAVLTARQRGHRGLVLPQDNLEEARLVDGLELYPVRTVEEAFEVLEGKGVPDDGARGPRMDRKGQREPDLSEIRGQFQARRALEIAAAGRHNLLLDGPPGSGKTMLARRMPSILPRLAGQQALDTARIHSVMRGITPAMFGCPPFRSPHHSASPAGLAGGGTPLRPGEFSLAHNGVLFLDEFPEFDRRALEVLREPLEEKVVHLTRAGISRTFPSDFLCIAAMNPCPCGFHGLGDGRCVCTPRRIESYRGRLSGPLLDRFDLRVFLHPVPAQELLDEALAESSGAVLARVGGARDRQASRWRDQALISNGDVSDRCIRAAAGYTRRERALLLRLVTTHHLSARAARRLERVARTIADLAGEERVLDVHLMEGLGFRLGGLSGGPSGG